MPKLRSRRHIRIPSLRSIGRSRHNKDGGNSSQDDVINHQDSNDVPISEKPTRTAQHDSNTDANPLLAEDEGKDESRDFVRKHYLKNMNSMATAPRYSRASQDDDDTAITPIISNCYNDGRSDGMSTQPSSLSLSKYSRDDTSTVSSATPIISNCHNNYPVKSRQRSDTSIPPIEESTIYGTEATDESIQNTIIPRQKDKKEKLKCAALLEKIVPFIVTILYFVAFILSSYASLSCKFMTCHLDFIPINIEIGQTDLEVGPWAFLALSDNGDGYECLRYPNDFSDNFIVNDSSWKATRACSVLSILIGWFGFLIIGVKVSRIELFVPGRCIQFLDTYWKAITIGNVTVLIILDCITFSFQNVDMCEDDKMWMRDDGKYLAADKCALSTGAFCSIFAMIFYGFVIILLASAPFCPLVCEKDWGGSSTAESSSNVGRDNLADQNYNSRDNTRYAFIPDSSDGSFDSADSFPLDDMNMKGLDSKKSSSEPPISFEPNIASCEMGDVEMQQMKKDSGMIREYTEDTSKRQRNGYEETIKIAGTLK